MAPSFRQLVRPPFAWVFGLAVLGVVAWLLVQYGPLIHRSLTVENLKALISHYGYAAIFLITVLGNIGLPVPEESTVFLSGMAAHEGLLSYPIMLTVCILSAIVGDNLGYLIGRTGGRPFLVRFGRHIGITESKLDNFETFVRRHGGKSVFIARFIGGLRFLAGPISGMGQMPFWRFFIANAAGAVLYVTVISQIGFHLGMKVLGLLVRGGSVLVGLLLAIAVMYLAVIAYRRYRNGEPR